MMTGFLPANWTACLKIVESFLLTGGDQNLYGFFIFRTYVVIKAYFRQIIRNMFFSVPVNRLFQFFTTHLRQNDIFYDHRMSADSRYHIASFNVMGITHVLDNFRNSVQLHNLPINNGVIRQTSQSRDLPNLVCRPFPSSSTAFTELEPISRPKTPFFLPNSIISLFSLLLLSQSSSAKLSLCFS